MKISSSEIRRIFLDYFAGHEHLVISSSSLIPNEDPTLLIVNSGMAPLKPYFTGEKTPPEQRLCNIQKCVRTNDIESIGDRHHLTFFEMMGNWSIGDYFKDEAITLAWGAIKDVFGFDTHRIYATVYSGDNRLPNIPPDEESIRIWNSLLPPERIIRLGANSNFWGPAGETGPCGPCTEVFIDRGEELGCGGKDCGPDCECGRFLEIWNAGVFMQYNLHESGDFSELPIKSVDAGAGLDRFSVILQEVDSVYETDLLKPIKDVIAGERANNISEKSIRVMTDHIRCATFMIADGIYTGNTSREYVLRRLLRRAFLHADLSGVQPQNLARASSLVVKMFSQYYPQLTQNQRVIEVAIKKEGDTFGKTLKRGLKEFEKVVLHSKEFISGEDAFKLHDTHGLPLDLLKEIAKEQKIKIDEEGYRFFLEEQRKRSRKK